MTTPDFFTPDAELKAENLELKQSVENLRAEVNRLMNVIAERDMQLAEAREGKYPCNDCGVLRTKAEGGTIFTVCDECWDKHYKRRGNHE